VQMMYENQAYAQRALQSAEVHKRNLLEAQKRLKDAEAAADDELKQAKEGLVFAEFDKNQAEILADKLGVDVKQVLEWQKAEQSYGDRRTEVSEHNVWESISGGSRPGGNGAGYKVGVALLNNDGAGQAGFKNLIKQTEYDLEKQTRPHIESLDKVADQLGVANLKAPKDQAGGLGADKVQNPGDGDWPNFEQQMLDRYKQAQGEMIEPPAEVPTKVQAAHIGMTVVKHQQDEANKRRAVLDEMKADAETTHSHLDAGHKTADGTVKGLDAVHESSNTLLDNQDKLSKEADKATPHADKAAKHGSSAGKEIGGIFGKFMEAMNTISGSRFGRRITGGGDGMQKVNDATKNLPNQGEDAKKMAADAKAEAAARKTVSEQARSDVAADKSTMEQHRDEVATERDATKNAIAEYEKQEADIDQRDADLLQYRSQLFQAHQNAEADGVAWVSEHSAAREAAKADLESMLKEAYQFRSLN